MTMAVASTVVCALGLSLSPRRASALIALAGCGSMHHQPCADRARARASPRAGRRPSCRRRAAPGGRGIWRAVFSGRVSSCRHDSGIFRVMPGHDERVTPRPRSRTWRRRAPPWRPCRPRPRTGRRGNSARRHRARSTAAPSHCRPEASTPPASTSAWRNMTMPSWIQRSKWPTHSCSLISEISACTSARRRSGTLRSKAQARCSASMSSIQVKESW